jgi:hypothetical protein
VDKQLLVQKVSFLEHLELYPKVSPMHFQLGRPVLRRKGFLSFAGKFEDLEEALKLARQAAHPSGLLSSPEVLGRQVCGWTSLVVAELAHPMVN